MAIKEVKTPRRWINQEIFGELIEVKTAYGNKVKIPKKYINGWQTARRTRDAMVKRGLDPLDGLETHREPNRLYYDLVRVFFEIYEEDA